MYSLSPIQQQKLVTAPQRVRWHLFFSFFSFLLFFEIIYQNSIILLLHQYIANDIIIIQSDLGIVKADTAPVCTN